MARHTIKRTQICKECNGRGRLDESNAVTDTIFLGFGIVKCRACGGYGEIEVEETIEIEDPPSYRNSSSSSSSNSSDDGAAFFGLILSIIVLTIMLYIFIFVIVISPLILFGMWLLSLYQAGWEKQNSKLAIFSILFALIEPLILLFFEGSNVGDVLEVGKPLSEVYPFFSLTFLTVFIIGWAIVYYRRGKVLGIPEGVLVHYQEVLSNEKIRLVANVMVLFAITVIVLGLVPIYQDILVSIAN